MGMGTFKLPAHPALISLISRLTTGTVFVPQASLAHSAATVKKEAILASCYLRHASLGVGTVT